MIDLLLLLIMLKDLCHRDLILLFMIRSYFRLWNHKWLMLDTHIWVHIAKTEKSDLCPRDYKYGFHNNRKQLPIHHSSEILYTCHLNNPEYCNIHIDCLKCMKCKHIFQLIVCMKKNSDHYFKQWNDVCSFNI